MFPTISKDFSCGLSSRVIIRVDFNEPMVNGVVRDDFRIKAVIPTIEKIRGTGAKILLISHRDNDESLEELMPTLSSFFPVSWVGDDLVEIDKKLQEADAGEVFLMENIRFFEGEEANDVSFAEQLARLGTHYVNEAFSVSHREHASIVQLPKLLPSAAGERFVEEYAELSKVFSPERPFLFIIGGAKFETKEPLIKKFLEKADTVFVGGALANDIFRARGFEVGKSRVSDSVIDQSIFENQKLMIPSDVMCESGGGHREKSNSAVTHEEKIVDVGSRTLVELGEKIKTAQTIVWNGPLGNYENGYGEQTVKLAQLISQSSAYSIIGGGDTLATLKESGILPSQFSFTSTGGGAMIYFLSFGTLPGIEALKSQKN